MIAYNGPNSKILGNIGNSYWTFHEIHDVPNVMIRLSQMIAIDIGASVICGQILWMFCNLDLLQEVCKLAKHYWSQLAIVIAIYMLKVKYIDKSFS